MLPTQRNQLTISILSRLRKGGAPEQSEAPASFNMDEAGFAPSGDDDKMNENQVMLGDADIDSEEADGLVSKKDKNLGKKKARDNRAKY